MTEELGVLVVELPQPLFDYTYLCKNGISVYRIEESDLKEVVLEEAYQCTRKEAEQFPQFKFVPLKELEMEK